MKNKTIFGIIAGVTASVMAGTAVALTTKKIVREIKRDMCDATFVSPDGDNAVELNFGASKTARGLTFVKVNATSENKDDCCKLIVFAKKKDELMDGEWIDNNHFKLLIGSGKRKQCCDVSFDGEQINALYYLVKNA
jgi:hypothetical protein